jgi:cytoskeletal protein RodZ
MTEENNYTTDELNEFEQTQQPLAAEEITSTSIGELLRLKREEKGLNLKTISQQTKIHMGLLEHLENNQLDKLPSKTYVRGFVKSTAKILGIDQETALNILELTYNQDHKSKPLANHNREMRNVTATNTLSSIASTPLDTVKSITASSTAFFAKIAVGTLIFGVIGFNIKNLIDRSAEEKLKLPQVFTTIHQKAKPAKPIAKINSKIIDTETTEATTPIQINLIQDKKDNNLKSEMTINDINLKTISLGEKQFTLDTSQSPEQLNEIFPSRYKVLVTKGVENVFINAVDGDSWITYKVDDKEIKKYVLRQGRTIFLRGEKVRLFLGNTKALKVFYNNKLINLGAKSGVKNLVLPEELKTKFMAPLFVFQKDGSVLTSDEYIKTNQASAMTSPANTQIATPVKPIAPKVAVPVEKKKI